MCNVLFQTGFIEQYRKVLSVHGLKDKAKHKWSLERLIIV